MSETSPVPTPFSWDVSLSGRSILCNGRIVASPLDPDDALLIVDSVNGSSTLKARVKELEEALEDCLALLKNIDEQVGPDRMREFRVDPYGTINDARALLHPSPSKGETL